MKRALIFVKFLFISFVWTVFVLGTTCFVFRVFWNFDLFSPQGWKIINNWWQNGGNIKTWQDFLFFVILFIVLPIIFFGIKYGMKIDLMRTFLSPIIYFMNRGLDEMPKNVTIKNIDVSLRKISKEEIIDKEVEKRMKAIKEQNTDNNFEVAGEIRKNLAEKK